MCRHGRTRIAVVTDKVVVYIIAIIKDVVCVDVKVQG